MKTVYQRKCEIDKIYDDKLSELWERLGMGFCFGREQLDEYKKKQRELGYEGLFVSLPIPGAVCRKETARECAGETHRINNERTKSIRESISMDEYIEYELSNHEAYYTYDPLDISTVMAIQYVYENATNEDILRVFNKTKHQH